jgi:DNA-binding NarL/FixJ family response regulator
MFSAVFTTAGVPALATLARLDITEIGRLSPGLLVCDVDALEVSPIEFLRQLRFVLPECLIVVYTGSVIQTWGLECHLAGANCLLAKTSSEANLALGIRRALRSGCYTDPRFAA